MPPIKSKDGLKSYLLTSRLLSPKEWGIADGEIAGVQSVAEALQILERRHLLTPLQSGRILKGETDGLVLGRYKLLYRNASGSFARVFRASTVDDNKVVALKLLRERWADDPRTVASFEREARICKKFVHPNIVPIYEIGNEGRFHYFTMEFVEGGNLRDFLKIRQQLSPVEATRSIYQICSALEYALTLGATHRDLKLTNVLMSSTGIAKLVDFGLAGAESPTQAGTSDDVQRALEYASLERGTNAPRNDPRSDLFFAGAIYYELLTGVSPWPRTSDREERLQLSRYANYRPLHQVAPSLPMSLVKVCHRMMEISPASRFQSAAETNRELRAVLAELGEPVAEQISQGGNLEIGVKPDFHLLIADGNRKRNEILKQYFEKHGYDVTFVKDSETAFSRLKGNKPPDGVLFLADDNALPVLDIFPQIQAYARSLKVPCVAVFSAEDAEAVKKKVTSTKYGATMFQPTTVRDIRLHFDEIGAVTR